MYVRSCTKFEALLKHIAISRSFTSIFTYYKQFLIDLLLAKATRVCSYQLITKKL